MCSPKWERRRGKSVALRLSFLFVARRASLAACAVVAGLVSACVRSSSSAPSAAPAARNVLLVTIDTLRADRVGAYGSLRGATPNLDRLAARAVVFEKAFTTAPLTLPAHASLLSGLWPFRHAARVNGSDVVGPDAPLLAQRLQQGGFATGAAVGSLVLRSGTGLSRGFDVYDDRFAENSGRAQREWNARRAGDEVVDRAAAWLDRVGDRRFFLWVHLYDPHAPYAPPPPYRGRFAGQPYDDAVAYADSCLGRLIGRLESNGLAADTLIAVAGDHGESLGEHGETTHGVFLYDATLHVPLLLALPGQTTPRRIGTPVSLADVAPTLAEAAGLPPAPADGESLLPLLSGRPAASHRVYAESVYPAALLGWSPLFAVRSEGAKYVEAPHPELYDLAADPAENRNVFSPSRADARALARELAAIRSARRATPAAPAGAPEALSRLTSLGYLTPSGPASDLDSVAHRADPKEGIRDWDSIERAIIARQSGRPREAAEMLTGVLAQGRSESPAVLRELALSLKSSGQIPRAIEVYDRILRSATPVADDFFRLGVCWHLLGRDDRAAHAHEQALERDPHDLDAWMDLGQERVALGRLEAAEQAFAGALRIDSRSLDALSGLAAVAYERHDDAAAAARLHEALDLQPDRLETLENLARVERRRGNAGEARRIEGRLSGLRKRGQDHPSEHPKRSVGG
jgi:choline-sulfatase